MISSEGKSAPLQLLCVGTCVVFIKGVILLMRTSELF